MKKERQNILQIYGLFLFSITLNIVPSSLISSIGILLLMLTIVAIYIYRNKAGHDSLQYNHMTYMIKSFWISSLLLIIGILVTYLLANHSIINNAVDSIMAGVVLSEEQMKEILMSYARENYFILAVTLLPSILYLLYRVIKGINFARQSKKIENSQSWF